MDGFEDLGQTLEATSTTLKSFPRKGAMLNRHSRSWQAANCYSMALAPLLQIQLHSINLCGKHYLLCRARGRPLWEQYLFLVSAFLKSSGKLHVGRQHF